MTSGNDSEAPTVTGSTPQNGENKPPQAIVKPQVLTHVIEGFVIQEGAEPFPVCVSVQFPVSQEVWRHKQPLSQHAPEWMPAGGLSANTNPLLLPDMTAHSFGGIQSLITLDINWGRGDGCRFIGNELHIATSQGIKMPPLIWLICFDVCSIVHCLSMNLSAVWLGFGWASQWAFCLGVRKCHVLPVEACNVLPPTGDLG